MPVDIQFNDANLNGYDDIPTTRYSTLFGLSLSATTVKHSTKPVLNGIAADGTGVYVTWNYPISDNLYVTASVGYQFQVVLGTFDPDSAQSVTPPGQIVYEEIVNMNSALNPEDRYINLHGGASGRVDIPSAILVGGNGYTVRVRALVFSEYGDGTLGGYYFKYTKWGVASFRVNAVPSAANLRINGEPNPLAISPESQIGFSFTLIDTDGPFSMYRIQVGTVPGVGFTANVWDSGLLSAGPSFGAKDFTVQFSGPPLDAGVTYAWRVNVQDGLSDAGWTAANDLFKINTRPTVQSIKVSGEEILFGERPTVGDSGLVLAWVFNDLDGDTQHAYDLVVSQITAGTTSEILVTGNVFSSSQSVTLPDLSGGSEIQIKLRVRDLTEFSDEYVANFFVNARPSVLDLRVDSEVNPGNVSTTTPVISWIFFDDTPGDLQNSFRIQVSTNDSFSSLVWDTGDVASSVPFATYGGTPSPVVAPVPLAHGSYYFFRVRINDGISNSDYEQGFFAVNTRPGSPTLNSPGASEYSGTLTVSWTPAVTVDADGDDVTYVVEMTSRRSSNSGWEFLSGPFPSSTTSYQLDLSDIKSDNDYGIRVLANDGFIDSDPSLGSTSPLNSSGLGFTIANHAPVTPVLTLPLSGTTVSGNIKVEWVEGNPVDVDGDDVFYVLEITRDASQSSPMFEKIGIFNEGTSKAIVDMSEFTDGANYRFRITAYDSRGAQGSRELGEIFALINTSAITDFERAGSSLYISTTDGKVFKASESIWQVERTRNAFMDKGSHFKTFSSGNPKVTTDDGRLVIQSAPGSTFIMRAV